MGIKMGNNNTSALKGEDSTSEAEKTNLLEEVEEENVEKENQINPAAKGKESDTKAAELDSNGTSEFGNETSKGDTNEECVKGENQTIPASEAKDVMEEPAKASDDATNELGKDTLEEDSHVDDIKGKNQKIPAAEDEDVEGKSNARMLENDSLEGDTHGDDVIVENQMHPTAEAEDVQGNTASAMVSDNETSALGNDSLEGDTCADDVDVDRQKNPSSEGKVVKGKAERIDLDDKTSELQKEDPYADGVNVDDQRCSTAEGEVVQGKPTRTDLDDKTSEVQTDKSQKYTHDNDEEDENATDPIAEDMDVQGKATSLSSEDQSNVKDSFSNAEAGGENCEILTNSMLEGTEDYEEQADLCLKKNLLVTNDHYLDTEPSTKQGEENTVVLTLDDDGISNEAELQQSSDVHSNHNNKLPEVPPEPSLQRSDLLDTNPLCSLNKDAILEKEMEIQEKMLCEDGGEFGRNLRYASEITDDPPSTDEKCKGSPLAKVNNITDDSMNSQPESDMVDKGLESDLEENCMVVYEERKLSRNGSKRENSQDFNPSHCWEEPLKEFEADMTNIVSNGDCNSERNVFLASSVSGISNTGQDEEPKVAENGHQFDEISNVSAQEDSVVPEAAVDIPITLSLVENCRHEEGENNMEKIIEEMDKMPEASLAAVKSLDGRDISEQCKSHSVITDQKESSTLQNNTNHSNSFTAGSVAASDWKQENVIKYIGATVNNLDSSNLTVPALDLVDDEAFEKEAKDYSQHVKATSLKEAEITTSEANLPSVTYSHNSIFAIGGYGSDAMESITRLSTESNPDNPNITALIQKSPSFNLNLRTEVRLEESDQIPLLHQGKTSLNLIDSSMIHAEYGSFIIQQEEMPVEEKIVTMERSYSEKFTAPFLGLLKEEEEAHLLVTPQKQENHGGKMKAVKGMTSASPKGKEKRKPRPFFFSSCMCCATATN